MYNYRLDRAVDSMKETIKDIENIEEASQEKDWALMRARETLLWLQDIKEKYDTAFEQESSNDNY